MEIEQTAIESYNLYYYWVKFSDSEQERLFAATATDETKEQWFRDRGVDSFTFRIDPESFEPSLQLRNRGPVDIDDIMLEFKLRWL